MSPHGPLQPPKTSTPAEPPVILRLTLLCLVYGLLFIALMGPLLMIISFVLWATFCPETTLFSQHCQGWGKP